MKVILRSNAIVVQTSDGNKEYPKTGEGAVKVCYDYLIPAKVLHEAFKEMVAKEHNYAEIGDWKRTLIYTDREVWT